MDHIDCLPDFERLVKHDGLLMSADLVHDDAECQSSCGTSSPSTEDFAPDLGGPPSPCSSVSMSPAHDTMAESSPKPCKMVRFQSSVSIITDFTPYCDVYGMHPAEFYFDKAGSMVRLHAATRKKKQSVDGLLCVDFGDTLECIALESIHYVKRPNTSVHREDGWVVEEGDRIDVLERSGAWIRDSVGWLPLIMQDKPLFSTICFNALPRRC